MVAAKLVNTQNGRPLKTASIDAVSQEEAANLLNVSRPSVQRAAQVQQKAIPELTEQVSQGNIAVSTAATLAELPKEEQTEIVAKGKEEIKAMARAIRAEEATEKESHPVNQAIAKSKNSVGYRWRELNCLQPKMR